MSSRLEFLVPGAPVPKQRPRLFHNRVITPRKTAAYEGLVARCAELAGAKPVKGPVVLRCCFYLPDRRVRDLDNLVKSVLDGLNEVAFVDDSQIERIEAEKRIDREQPRAWVSVEALEP